MTSSHPDSPNYGNHYTAEQIHELFAPHQDTVDVVREWLHSAGLHPDRISQSVNKQWLQFDAKVSEVEELLRAKYHIFEHHTGKETIGCDEYHVPEHVQPHIDYITPGIRLLANERRRPSKRSLAKRDFGLPPLLAELPALLSVLLGEPLTTLCSAAITPECIMTMYNISAANSAVKGNELGIFEDLADYYAQEDLNLFFASLQPRIPQGTHPILEGVDGGTAPNPTGVVGAGPESDLDFQISYPLIWPQNSILFQTDDSVYEANYTFEGFFNNFLDAVSLMSNILFVV